MRELDGLPVSDQILPHPKRWQAGRGAKVRVVVIHTSEGGERPGSAVALARWMRLAPAQGAAPAAYHWTVDPQTIVPCVRPSDTAWGAAGSNPFAEHICIAGRAGQDAAGWADADSHAAVILAGRLLGARLRMLGLPLARVDAAGLITGQSGVCGHADVAHAFGKTDHWDPGPNFPWPVLFLAAASTYQHVPAQPTTGDDDMVLPAKILTGGREAPIESDAYYTLVRSDGGIVGIAGRHDAALIGQQYWNVERTGAESSTAWLTFAPNGPVDGIKHVFHPGGGYRGVAIVAADGGVFVHELA